MEYDFTSIMDRKGKGELAVDAPGLIPGFAPAAPKEGFDLIPMWIADMSFPTAPSVLLEIQKRLEHTSFGYFMTSKEYYDAIINWQKERNQIEGLEKGHIGYENGVLGGVVSALKALAQPGEKILVHSPTYIGFTNSIENAGYKLVHSPLTRDEEGVWRMDYEDMDKTIKKNRIRVAVFCNPHNPSGRVWTREELEKAMAVYKENNCIVISDEIWSDIILEDNKHIPLQSISEDAKMRTIAFYAPSKTFSLAGLIGSYHIIYNPDLKARVTSVSTRTHYNSINVLSMHALIGAYSQEGMEWVDQLREVLSQNVKYAYEHITEKYKGVTLAKPEGTYMLFLNCTKWCEEHQQSLDELMRAGWDVGVAWQDGRPFHGENAIRMNLALPFEKVKEAFERLDKYVFHV